MKKLWLLVGRICFWCSWPALWIYLRWAQRSRLLIINDQSHVLVVKGWLSTQKWSLPGGGLHLREDPKLGAIRETSEEIGINLSPASLRLLAHRPVKSKGFVADTWLYGTSAKECGPIRKQRFEIIEAAWVDAASLTAVNAEPDVLLAVQAWSESAALVQ